ncbi:MAG: DNA2/NAM7 family helicase [Bacillus sp. (in: Bacteria)]|nr:DNA2/NAM7 family helicase [Bacillus sp. (in: firmicutes)]
MKLYEQSPESVVSFFQKKYYERRKAELEKQIIDLEDKLHYYSFDNEIEAYHRRSMKLFKGKLVDSYGAGGSRKVFGPDALWKEEGFRSFIQEYPVILSTTHSLRYCAAKDYLFDYVLIDEASQVDIVTGALALSVAKNAVIVGDLKQLPNVVDGGTRRIAADIYQSYELGEAYDYGKHSLLSSFNALYQDIPKTLLKEHYRCHPRIIEFCNQKFYDNELIVLTEGGGDEEDVAEAGSGAGVVAAKGKPLILYKTVKGNHARGRFNQRQIDVVFQEIIPNERINLAKKSVGVVTPFRLQADKLQEVIGEQRIEADTVHKYQGRERDIIILTTVANAVGQNDFVDDPNLVNVAVSRAVDQLIVVAAEGSENWKGTNLGDLVRYIKYNNFEVMESEIRSVFDLLYKGYSERLLEVMKGRRKVSRF